jgi:hypothetical protein
MLDEESWSSFLSKKCTCEVTCGYTMLDEESWSSFLSVASIASPALVERSPLPKNKVYFIACMAWA